MEMGWKVVTEMRVGWTVVVNNRKDSCSGVRVENCDGVVCACGGEVVKKVYACCVLVAILEHWNNWNTNNWNIETLEQLEHWNNWNIGTIGTLEHWNNWNTETLEQLGQQKGGCGLCREVYRTAGNFRRVQFLRKGDLQKFRGLIFADGRSRTAPSTIPG